MQALVSPTPHSLIPTVTQICAKHTSHPCPATTPCLQVYTRSWCLHPALGRVCAAALLPAPFRVTFALFPQPQEHSPQPLYSCALCLERSAPCPPRLPPLTSSQPEGHLWVWPLTPFAITLLEFSAEQRLLFLVPLFLIPWPCPSLGRT